MSKGTAETDQKRGSGQSAAGTNARRSRQRRRNEMQSSVRPGEAPAGGTAKAEAHELSAGLKFGAEPAEAVDVSLVRKRQKRLAHAGKQALDEGTKNRNRHEEAAELRGKLNSTNAAGDGA